MFKMKVTMMSKRGVGCVAGDGSNVEDYGDRKVTTRTASETERVSNRIQRAGVKKVLGSVHKMNVGGNAVVLEGERSYTQSKTLGQKTRISYEDGQYVMHTWVPSKESEARKESSYTSKGIRYAILAAEGDEVFNRQV